MSIKKTHTQFVKEVEALGKGYTVLGTYKNTMTKIEILCSNVDHGSFFITPDSLLRGRGCSKCVGHYVPTQVEFEKIVSDLNKNYKVLGRYTTSSTKIEIQCLVKDHGSFMVRPGDLIKGHGCPKCAYNMPTQSEFKQMVSDLNKDFTVIGLYTNARTKVEIKCSNPDHGSFFTTPNCLFKGIGCPLCARYGFQPNKSAILYYFSIDTEAGPVYKVGISNRTFNQRYSVADRKISHLIHVIKFENGADALAMEQKIIAENQDFRYNGPALLDGVGTSEMFTHDVLGLDI